MLRAEQKLPAAVCPIVLPVFEFSAVHWGLFEEYSQLSEESAERAVLQAAASADTAASPVAGNAAPAADTVVSAAVVLRAAAPVFADEPAVDAAEHSAADSSDCSW